MNNTNDEYYVNGVLKSTSLGIANIPSKLIKKLGWKIHEPIEIRISDCSNEPGVDWQEVTIMRIKDIAKAYPDE